MRSEYDANRYLAASGRPGLSCTAWREPQGLLVLGAHPTYWMALSLTLAVAIAGGAL